MKRKIRIYKFFIMFGNTNFDRNFILKELNISKSTYYRYFNYLYSMETIEMFHFINSIELYLELEKTLWKGSSCIIENPIYMPG